MRIAAAIVVLSSLLVARPALRHGEHPVPVVSSFHHDDVLGTSVDLTFVGTSATGAAHAEAVVLGEIERLRRVLSSWDSTSEVSRLFASGALDHPSAELVAVLDQYTRWTERTGHAYSSRVGELTALWRDAADRGVAPDSAALATAVRDIAAPAWRIDRETGRITALTTHRVDLSSLGKGFIIDRALEAVRDSAPGLRGVLIDIGGDIHVWGASPAGDAWHIAVTDPAHPADNATPLARLALRGGAVSSSGDYQRGFTVGARHYSHIVDPRTGYPVDHVTGVTVLAPDNATANALATTLSVLAPNDGIALARETPDVEALLVTAAGGIIRTPGFAAYEDGAPPPPATPAPAFTAKLDIDVTPMQRNRHAPYVAVWITDTAGRHVRTLAFWANKPKYEHELSKWWGAHHTDRQLLDAVTRATRRAGKYTLEWDGLDQKGGAAPAGAYVFWLEAAFEDGAHSVKSTTLACGPTHGAGTIASAAAFAGAQVSCDPAKH